MATGVPVVTEGEVFVSAAGTEIGSGFAVLVAEKVAFGRLEACFVHFAVAQLQEQLTRRPWGAMADETTLLGEVILQGPTLTSVGLEERSARDHSERELAVLVPVKLGAGTKSAAALLVRM